MFSYSLILFGIAAGLLSFAIYRYFTPQNIEVIEKIPRNIVLGIIFAIIDVAWCIPQAISIFTPSSLTIIYVAAIVVLFAGCLFLDYLFARALAGFLILLTHYFLHASFSANISHLWLFSVACYLVGIVGIIIGGMPYLLRNMLRSACNHKGVRLLLVIIFALYALQGIVTGIHLI